MTVTIQDAVVASVYGPDLENVQIYDQRFHVKSASVKPLGEGADVDGSISRIRRGAVDDQVHYAIRIRDGAIQDTLKSVNQGGWGGLLEAIAVPIARAKKVDISKEEIHQIVEELDNLVYRGGWDFIVDRIIAGIGLTVLEEAIDGFPPKSTYLLIVKTGSDEDAGTDAHVHATLFGHKLDQSGNVVEVSSGLRYLATGFKQMNDFEAARAEIKRIQTKDIGELQSIVVGHDNHGDKPGWLLESVTVQNPETGHQWVFLWNNWLSENAGLATPKIRPTEARASYRFIVRTGSAENAGTGAKVWITLGNRNRQTGRYFLSEKGRNNFESGQDDVFVLDGEEIGDITYVALGHNGAGEKPGWFLDSVTVERDDLGRRWIFRWGHWLASGEPGSDPDGAGRRTPPIPLTQIEQYLPREIVQAGVAEGNVIKAWDGPAVFLVENAMRRWVLDEATFLSRWTWDQVKQLPAEVVDSIPRGLDLPPIA